MAESGPNLELHPEILRRIAAQEREALAEFYDRTAGVIYGTVLRMLGDPSEAEEVVQDVFVQVWTKAGSYDARLGKPINWALGIARNRSIDRLRARQRRSKVFQETTDEDFTAVAATEMDSPALLGGDDAAAVQAAVKSLPPDQQQAIELAFFRGLSHAEVAEALGEPLGTVKARIRRGMLKLREDLQAFV